MPASNPVIVVPGITASYLYDRYPMSPETVWAVLARDYRRVGLHPQDTRYEAVEPARITSGQPFAAAYGELVEELRYNLSGREDDPVPVYPFGYDWRHPLGIVEEQLAEFIEEVIARTRLMPNYHPAWARNPKVNLLGHSMGGLVVAGYLEAYGGRGHVGRVATLASPFRGSFEAVIKVTTGTANMGTEAPGSREREAARLTPALYHLLPSFSRGLTIPNGLPDSLYDPALWQPSIVGTIAEFIRLHGVGAKRSKAEVQKRAGDLFAALLGSARDHRERLETLSLQNAGLSAEDWLCVVGVGATTRVSLRVKRVGRKPSFDLRSSDRCDKWESGADADERRATGDGTVPFDGAVPAFLPFESLVCVSPDDFGYWELLDKAATRLAGFHGILPNMNMLHRLVVRHFTGRRDRRGNTWGRLPPGVAKGDWRPPVPGLAPKG